MNGSRSARLVKRIRNEVLVVLKLLYPNALQADQILRSLLGLFPDLEWDQLKRDLAYLCEKGYLHRVVTDLEEQGGELTPWRSRWFRLTTQGMEVADHCIQDPALEE